MPEITLLQPRVLAGVIEELEFPDTFRGLQLIGAAEPYPFPTAEWDVIASSREIAAPNVPNAEAKIVPQLGVAKRTAAMVYLREKKVFRYTTLHWLRTPGQIAQANAERAVMREIEDLDRRFNAFAEFTIWAMLQGALTLDYYDVKATVDYLIQASHQPSVSVAWSDHDNADVIGDITGWKLMVSEDAAGAALGRVFVNSNTLNHVVQNAGIHAYFSDRMKEQYLAGEGVQGLLGLNWEVYDSVYVDGAGATQKYVKDDNVIAIAEGPQQPYRLLEGPSADHESPDGHTGKYAKSWIEPDPSNRQYLEEWHFLPILERPDQIVAADVSGP